MASIDSVEFGRPEPVAMEPQAYRSWLQRIQRPDGSWAAGFSARTLADAANISYRQADYWARESILIPEILKANGSGSHRQYSFEDICRGALISRLIGEFGSSDEARGHTLEAASLWVERIRQSGKRICEASGVLAPTPDPDSPLLLKGPISPELQRYVALHEQDIRALATVASERIILPPQAA